MHLSNQKTCYSNDKFHGLLNFFLAVTYILYKFGHIQYIQEISHSKCWTTGWCRWEPPTTHADYVYLFSRQSVQKLVWDSWNKTTSEEKSGGPPKGSSCRDHNVRKLLCTAARPLNYTGNTPVDWTKSISEIELLSMKFRTKQLERGRRQVMDYSSTTHTRTHTHSHITYLAPRITRSAASPPWGKNFVKRETKDGLFT